MQLHSTGPDWLGRRYSARVATVLAVLAVATLGMVALVGSHVLGAAEGGAVPTETVVSGLAGLSIVVLLNLGVVALLLGTNVGHSLAGLADAAERVGAGELDADLRTDRTDEIGRAYAAVDGMRDSMRETIEELEAERERAHDARRTIEGDNRELVAEAEAFGEVMEACADGDLTRRLNPETDDEAMRQIAASFNRMLSELERTVLQVQRFTGVVDDASAELQSHAQEIGEASESVSQSIREISEGSSSQTRDLEAAAAEVKDLSATIEEVAATTSTIAQASDRVSALADDGQAAAATAAEEMHDAEDRTAVVAETIARLNEDAERIGESIALIDDIAQQTNMLALNAAIETARTDEGGPTADAGGFDVVADEVQELSGEIQEAVDEIQGTIDAIQERARESAEEIDVVEDRIGTASGTVDDLEAELERMTERIDRVNHSVQEIDRASTDQAGTVEQLAGLVENVAIVSAETSDEADRVSRAAQEAASEIGEVSTKARSLDAHADRLANVVEAFEVSSRQQLAAGEGDEQ